jgi:hypothetical protein
MSPIFSRFNKKINPKFEEKSDLTTTILKLIYRNNLKLKSSTEMNLIYKIDMQLDIRKTKLRKQKKIIGKFRKKLKEIKKTVKKIETTILR